MIRPAHRTLPIAALLVVCLTAGCDRSSLDACQAPSVVEEDRISAQGPPPPPPTRDEASVRSHIHSCSGGGCEIEVREVLFSGTEVPTFEAPKVMDVRIPRDRSYQQSSPPNEFRLILRHEDEWWIDEIRSVDCK